MASRSWWEGVLDFFNLVPYEKSSKRPQPGKYDSDIPRTSTGIPSAPYSYQMPGQYSPQSQAMGGYTPPPQPSLQDLYNQWDALIPQFVQPGGASAQVTSAYDKAIAGIQGRYQKALEDIHGRESKAQEVLGQMPQDIMNIYTQGEGSAQEGVNRAFDTAQTLPEGYALPQDIQKAGFNEGEISAPFDAAIQGMQSDRLADVKYLDMGTGQFFGGMRDQLNAEMAAKLSEVELARTQHLSNTEQNNNALNLQRAQLIFGMLEPQVQQQMLQQQSDWTSRFGDKSEAEAYYSKDPAGRQEISSMHGQYIAKEHPEYVAKWKEQYAEQLPQYYAEAAELGAYAAAMKYFPGNPGFVSYLIYESSGGV